MRASARRCCRPRGAGRDRTMTTTAPAQPPSPARSRRRGRKTTPGRSAGRRKRRSARGAAMVDPGWPEAAERRLIGKRVSRLDGPAKVTGAAKYTYDIVRPGMLYAKMVCCPHAHARITKLDTSAAAAMPGVKAVRVVQDAGTEIQWALSEIAIVAAATEE